MQLKFVGRHIEVTPALKDFTAEKFKPLEKRYSSISHVDIVLHVEKITHIAEATVHLHGTEIHATAKDDDMYKAIDVLVAKLLGQISRYKEKLTEQQHS
jgi:putative sigma-54 modulation protein